MTIFTETFGFMTHELIGIIISIAALLVSIALLFLSNKLEDKISSSEQKALPSDGKVPFVLGTGNMIGFTMLGNFRREL